MSKYANFYLKRQIKKAKLTCSFNIGAASGKCFVKYSYTSSVLQFVISGMVGSMGTCSFSFEGALSISCGFKNGSAAGEFCFSNSKLLGMIAGEPTTVGRDSRQLLHSHWSQAFCRSGMRGV